LKVVVGLGYVQRDFAREGTRLVIESESGPMPSLITRLV
jgi:hypothetical protein